MVLFFKNCWKSRNKTINLFIKLFYIF